MSKQTYAVTQVQRVIPDAQLSDSVKTGVIKSLMRNGELVDHVLEEMTGSIGVRAERLYAWAEGGHYVHGLPSGQFWTDIDGRPEVQAVLNAIEGAPVTMDYMHIGPANRLHIGWMSLVNNYGYNQTTNELTVLSAIQGAPVYLTDMWVVVPQSQLSTIEPRQLETWGTAAKAGLTHRRSIVSPVYVVPTPVKTNALSVEDYLFVAYEWANVDNELSEGSMTLPITNYNDNDTFFHAKYVTAGGATKYWMYLDGAGTYPSLDEFINKPPVLGGEFFPFLHFRHNSNALIGDTSTEHYKDSKKWGKYLGIDYGSLGAAIQQNPDIGQVEEAMILFAVPAGTTNQIELRYLFDFFGLLWAANPTQQLGSKDAEAIARAQGGILSAFNALTIQDKLFKMMLTNTGVYKRRRAGSIGPVGTYAGASSKETVTGFIPEAGEEGTYDVQYHYYRQQISTGFYDEITVRDMQTVFRIRGRHSTIGDGTNPILIVPLDHTITENYTLTEREELYGRSLHYVFNALVVIHLKWYQEEFFLFIVIVVAIVITILSEGGTIELLAAALAAGEVSVALSILITTLLEQVIISQLFKLFVKLVGIDIAFVVAIVAAMSGASLAASGTEGLAGTPWAKELLALSTGLSSAVQTQLGADMADLVDQASEFSEYQQEVTAELEAGSKLLEGNLHLSPFLIFGEKPTDYFNRTVHSGNIGVLVGIQSVSTFVDSSLKLPTLAETLGDTYASDEL